MPVELVYKTAKRIIHPNRLKKIISKIIDFLFGNRDTRNKLELNIVFVDNSEITELNKRYLRLKGPTDVLCFKYDKYCGDIIISLTQVEKNAEYYGVKPEEELLFVLVHGFLHFKGMRDNTIKQRQQMYEKANKIMPKLTSL
ncbi:MAG: rRNA maturation RNase YbeY [Endomicrobia bacterium]|nr:rRNA maturation RNase YbeY [Endomicrobiia bacterium]